MNFVDVRWLVCVIAAGACFLGEAYLPAPLPPFLRAFSYGFLILAGAAAFGR